MIGKSDKPLTGQPTIIGANVKLVGSLNDAHDITIHGTVEGDIHSENTVTIGETAKVKGPVIGRNVTVSGVVRGSIEATEKLELLQTGKVYGNISAGDLVIRSGAHFAGKCSMLSAEAHEESPRLEDSREEKVEKASNPQADKAEFEVE